MISLGNVGEGFVRLTSDQVVALAPDSGSASNGKKLANTRHWKSLGQNDAALWGECQGSGKDPYQVRVDLATNEASCSCPSRKFPCKHGLGLMLLAISMPDAVPTSAAPDWVQSWLAKRAANKAKQEAKQAAPSDELMDEATAAQRAKEQAKRIAQREAKVAKGLDRLDLWLTDLMRNGLEDAKEEPSSFWEGAAAQLVDSQAGTLANRVRQLASIPGSGADWPERLLGGLGRVTLLTTAYRRADTLDPALCNDVRQMIGWSLSAEEVAAHGERVTDEWLVLGQFTEEENYLRTQRVWLQGANSHRNALILQTGSIKTPFPEVFVAGDWFAGTLLFWPGAYPLRAKVERRDVASDRASALAGPETIEGFYGGMSDALARQPWLERFPCVLRNMTPVVVQKTRWLVRDTTGATLPLRKGDFWRLLALSGGHPLTLACEWEDDALAVMGAEIEGHYHPLGGMQQ